MDDTTDGTIDIDLGAPVISREDILIRAPLATVWGLHTGVDAWPGWRSDVDRAVLAGPFAVGSVFRWATAGLDITSTIAQVVPSARTTWGGPAGGVDGVHVWEFSSRDDGVLVSTRESWNGDAVQGDAAAIQPALDASLRTWLGDLRTEAERIHPTP